MEIEQDKTMYGEKRTINIGDFESHSIFCSFTSSVRQKGRATVIDLEESDETIVRDSESFIDAHKRVRNNVIKVLDKRETIIRKRSNKWVDFETMLKVPKKK